MATTTFTLTLGGGTTWDRPVALHPYRLSNSDTNYGAVSITVPTGGTGIYTITTIKPNSNAVGDPVIFLWDNTFNNPTLGADPVNDGTNATGIIEAEDDDGVSNYPILQSVSLTAGQTYWIVLSSFFAGETGNVDFSIDGPAVLTAGGAGLVDTTAPTLSSSTPADDATAVAIGSNIVLNFSETVVAGTGDFIIKKADGTTVATIPVSNAQVSISGSTVTINPSTDLDYATSYYVEIASGVFKDSANNNYAGISGSTTLNFTTASAPSSPSSGGSSDPEPSSQPPATPVDTTPTDPAPAGTNIQSTDADGDGLREIITALDGTTIDGNRDGIPDFQQTEVAGLRLINDGAVGSDYGALVVSQDVRLSAVTLTAPTEDGSIPVTARGGGTVVTTTPDGITNAFAGVISFDVTGVTPGGSTQATISFPAGLPADSGNAYVRFNYSTGRFEEFVDANGNPLYTFIDSDGDGTVDGVSLTLTDGDPNWDGDGAANGTVVDPGFLGSGERLITGTKRGDRLIGNVLANTLNGKKGNDWLVGDLGNDILKGSRGKDGLFGGEGADLITGGKDRDRIYYTDASESSVDQRDTVKFGKQDRFVFSSFDGDSVTEGQQKLTFIGKSTFSSVAGELRATRSVLEADLNGDSIADFAINLRGNTLISSSNLVL